jgi:hypothetical protein
MAPSHARKRIRVLVLGGLISTVVATPMLAAWALWYLPYGRQMLAASTFEKLGGKVEIDPNGPQWLRNLFGDRFAADVVEVQLYNCDQVTDNDLCRLSVLRNLKFFGLVNAPRVTHAGLLPLEKLQGLEKLYLVAAPVTDRGLEKLKQLSGLRDLVIQGLEVTDAGIAELEELTNLERLALYDNPLLTDSCIPSIAKLTKLRELEIAYTGVTDAGLAGLSNLNDLQTVRFGTVMRYPNEEHLMEALDRSVPLTLGKAPLRDVLDYLQDLLDLAIVLDEESFAEEGIDMMVAITCDSTATLETHLNSMLKPLGLLWFLESGTLGITTQTGASKRIPLGIMKLLKVNPHLRIQWKLE